MKEDFIMRVVPYQEIQLEKFARQQELLKKGAEMHANGHAFHIGKISPGCRKCFTGEQGSGVQIGTKCMCNCPYCYYDINRGEETMDSINSKLADWFFMSQNLQNFKPTIFSYQSAGETVAYLDELEKFALILNDIGDRNGINHYYFVYTNGILCNEENLKRMKEMRVEELRFHVSASFFSKQVYNNMEKAANMGFRITVEEPSWSLHRDKLFEMLPILDSVGGKHLDLVEVQISPGNRDAIMKYYADNKYRAFKDFYYHLYDDGMVYDIMEEVLDKKYSFSVMDCSSAVERCRHNDDQEILFDWATVEGLCDDWDYGPGFKKTYKNLGIIE
jgi:pyruvate formate-lyase activating enzyme-like uncharacterized protein